ncbi:MAG TPA: hypothetical protein GX393_05825 [Firmicutes bacterium]|nr:hypothetical protein [Bacillota bacterium]
MRRRGIIQVCPQCGATAHLECWRAAGRCPQCGWQESSEPTK